jgi:WD40 repeat protein
MDSVVNCIAFSPWEYGLTLAAGTASGYLHIFRCSSLGDSPQWKHKQAQVSIPRAVTIGSGVKALSFAPSFPFNEQLSADQLM